MRILKFIIAGLTIVFLTFYSTSCGPTFKLSESDLAWMPYKGNETLVFNSNTGGVDTIFLIGVHRRISSRDWLFDPFPPKFEHFEVLNRYTDPYNDRYLEGSFFHLVASREKNNPYFNLHLAAKNSRFYGFMGVPLEKLERLNEAALQIKSKTYTDVIILKSESNEFSDRSDFVTKVYWSKSEGLIRFDKKDSVYWELSKKYVR